MRCLNEVCPLNKDKECINDMVISGKGKCYGKDKVQDKEVKTKRWNIK